MNERDAKALFRQAADVYKDGDYKDALKIFDRLDAAFPNNERIMFPRARCFAKLGRTDEAVAICDVLIARYGHKGAAELRGKLVSGEFKIHAPPGTEDTAFAPLDLNVDEKLSSTFDRAKAPVKPRRFPTGIVLGGLVVAGVLLIGLPLALGGGGDDERREDERSAESDAPMAATPAPPAASTPAGMPPIDTSAAPERIRVEGGASEDGVTVNASVEFGVWTNCGSYDAFVEKLAACEPAAIRMMTMGTFVMEYRVLGEQDGVCRIEVKAVQMPMDENWSGKSMICPCDPTMDFIELTEHLNVQGILDGTLDCEGALFDAMKQTLNRP